MGLGLWTVCILPGVQGDDDKPQPATSTIIIEECRVLFVDLVPIASPRAGILSRVADEGSRVSAGESVATLQDDVPRSALAVADARAASDVDIRLARKKHEQAAAEYQAALTANAESRGGVPVFSEVEVTRRRLAMESAELEIEQAERDLEVLRRARDEEQAELEIYSIRSPIDGIVTRSLKRPGEGVQLADPILNVIDPEVIRVEGFVRLDDVDRLEASMLVQVFAVVGSEDETDPGLRPREIGPYDGHIGFVDLAVQPVARTVRVWADVRNTDGRLRDGMTARMVVAVPPVRSPNTPVSAP